MRFGILCSALVATATSLHAQGIERTARPIFNPSTELQLMQMVPACPEGSLVSVSGTRLVCANMARFAEETWEANVFEPKEVCRTTGSGIDRDTQCSMSSSALNTAGWNALPNNKTRQTQSIRVGNVNRNQTTVTFETPEPWANCAPTNGTACVVSKTQTQTWSVVCKSYPTSYIVIGNSHPSPVGGVSCSRLKKYN